MYLKTLVFPHPECLPHHASDQLRGYNIYGIYNMILY